MGIYAGDEILGVRIRNVEFQNEIIMNSIGEAIEKYKTLPSNKDWIIETLLEYSTTYGPGTSTMWFEYTNF